MNYENKPRFWEKIKSSVPYVAAYAASIGVLVGATLLATRPSRLETRVAEQERVKTVNWCEALRKREASADGGFGEFDYGGFDKAVPTEEEIYMALVVGGPMVNSRTLASLSRTDYKAFMRKAEDKFRAGEYDQNEIRGNYRHGEMKMDGKTYSFSALRDRLHYLTEKENPEWSPKK